MARQSVIDGGNMPDEPDYIVEIGGRAVGPDKSAQKSTADDSDSAGSGRSYISVLFECCNVYQRVYKNRQGTAYEGHCPRCARAVRVKIGPGGTEGRFFRAT